MNIGAAIGSVILHGLIALALISARHDHCRHGERDLAVGQSVEAGDGCNSCVCQEDGTVMCTRMICVTVEETEPPATSNSIATEEVAKVPETASAVEAEESNTSPTTEPPAPAPRRRVARPRRPREVAATLPEDPVETPAAPVRFDQDLEVDQRRDSTNGGTQPADGHSSSEAEGSGLGSGADRPAPESGGRAGIVRARDLSAPPRSPDLTALLERNYPPAARATSVEGRARVWLRIEPTGVAHVVRTISESPSGFGFGSACRATLEGQRFSAPLDRDGRPVATELAFGCRFNVRW